MTVPSARSATSATAPGVAHFPADRAQDALLVAAAARGDQQAIRAIWDRYAALVRGVVRNGLGPRGVVDDIVQEVFLAFVRGAKNIVDGASLRGYLVGTAVRLVALEIRRNKVRRWVTLSPSGELPEQPIQPRDVVGLEAVRALDRVLAKLTTRRRMAFVLRDVEGLEMLDAASALGVSESTLRRDLLRAREYVLAAASREPALVQYFADRGSRP